MKQHPTRWAMLLGALILAGLAVQGVSASDEFERIREKAEEMLVAINDAEYATFAEGKNSSLGRAYGDFGYLLTPSKLEDLEELVAASQDDVEKARRTLTADILRYHAMRSASAALIDNTRDSFRDKGTQVEEGLVVLRGLDHRIGREESQDVRRKWALASNELYTAINVYLTNLTLDLGRQAQKLGYEGYYPFLQAAEGWDVPLMQAAAESLLSSTQASYDAALEKWTGRELDLPVRKVRSYDAARLLFFPRLSQGVRAADPEAICAKTLKDLGIDLGGQRNLRADLKDRPGREPEATAYMINKGKARVVMTPTGFVTDVQDLLAAFGEAEFYYNIPGDVPFESAYFGNTVLPSIYRELFAGIAGEPGWVARHLKLDGVSADEVAEALRFRSLLRAREAAGRLLFQLELHANPAVSANRYNEIMERALGWPRISLDAEAYLAANDDFRSGGLVLGALIAAQIRETLRREWGEEWFLNAELGRRLEHGAARGFAMPLAEFLGIWQLDGVHMEPLVAELQKEESGS